MIYLASPFSHSDPDVEKIRHDKTLAFTAHYIREGYPIFSPIVYGFPFYREGMIGGAAVCWENFNRMIIHTCSEMWVLQIEGWNRSVGVEHEIKLANSLRLPITHMQEFV